jgi:putative cell wall-binding protein
MELVAENGRRWDPAEEAPWTAYRRETCTATYGCVTAWRQLWFDDAESLKLRYDLVNGYDLRGAGIWALGYDDARTELNQALAAKFQYFPVLDRIGGADRYATAAAISQSHFAAGPAVAYVATGANFPDALAGAAVAGMQNAPLLLVTSDTVPWPTQVELTRLKPAKVVVLGGPGVISDAVAAALDDYATSGVLERHAGVDRYATAAAISQSHFAAGPAVAYVATGANFPDALAGAAVAGMQSAPILLVTRDTLPAATAAELSRLKPARIVVLGGLGVVSDAVRNALAAAAL